MTGGRRIDERRLAVAGMLLAVLIYGANFVLTRHAVRHGFTPADITALRFGTAGLILLPFFLHRGALSCAGVGWGRGVALAVTSGAPMALLMNAGLGLAPAAHGATLQPGTVTVVGVVGSALLFGVRPSRAVLAGIAIVLVGLTFFGFAGGVLGPASVALGDLLFVLAGLLWGSYPLLLQRWSVPALTGTAVVAVLSLAYLPFYLALLSPDLSALDPWVVAFHAVNQGILNVIVGLWLWGFAVRVLGAAAAQRFPPLVPVVGTLLAIPVLGEWPGPVQTFGASLIVGGLLVAAFGGRVLTRP